MFITEVATDIQGAMQPESPTSWNDVPYTTSPASGAQQTIPAYLVHHILITADL